MSIQERIIMMIASLPTRSRSIALEQKTGVEKQHWTDIHCRRIRPTCDDLEALAKVFPEHALWLMTGKTSLKHRQTAPDITNSREKREQKQQKN